MAAFGPPHRRVLSICTMLLVAGFFYPIASQAAPAANADSPSEPDPPAADPPQASLQDPPDLVIFQTGEVRGVLLPGG